jgi:chitin synthase
MGASTGNLSSFSQTAPLVGHAQQAERDDFDDGKTMRSYDEYAPTHFTSHVDDSTSNVGTEAYAPSKNMFADAEKAKLRSKELDGQAPAKEETTEVYKTSGARKKWLALVWALTWWLPSPVLGLFKAFKRPDVRQAWREKLAINLLIWSIMGSAVFVIAILGNLICPRQYVFSAGEISQQSYTNNPDKEYVSIRGEVFDVSATPRSLLGRRRTCTSRLTQMSPSPLGPPSSPRLPRRTRS